MTHLLDVGAGVSVASTLRRTGLLTEHDGLIFLTGAARTTARASLAVPARTVELLEQWRTALQGRLPAPSSTCSSPSIPRH